MESFFKNGEENMHQDSKEKHKNIDYHITFSRNFAKTVEQIGKNNQMFFSLLMKIK